MRGSRTRQTARKYTGGYYTERARGRGARHNSISNSRSKSNAKSDSKMAAATTSKMEKVASVSTTWTFENWNKCHRLLAAKAECIAKIGDIVLRFFLRPVKKQVKVNKYGYEHKFVINEWYSLFIELVSSQQEASLVVTSSSFRFPRLSESGGVQVLLQRTPSNTRGTTMIIDKFLFSGKRAVNDESGSRDSDDWSDSDDVSDNGMDVDDAELQIPLTVTLFNFEQTCSGLNVVAAATPGTTPRETENLFLKIMKANISAVYEETEGKLFSDALLHMNDGVTLHAHRLILTGASPVFKAMFTTDMKESMSGDVTVPDISSGVMKIVLAYVYTGSVSSYRTQLTERISEVVYAASKYQLDDLVSYLDTLIITLVNPGNAMELLTLAKAHRLPTASASVTEYVKMHSAEILMSQVDGD